MYQLSSSTRPNVNASEKKPSCNNRNQLHKTDDTLRHLQVNVYNRRCSFGNVQITFQSTLAVIKPYSATSPTFVLRFDLHGSPAVRTCAEVVDCGHTEPVRCAGAQSLYQCALVDTVRGVRPPLVAWKQ